MNEAYILACSLPSWYRDFQASTIESDIIPLSPEFVMYLHEDGVFLPPSLEPKTRERTFDDYDYGSDEDEGEARVWTGDEFLDLQEKLRERPKQFGGKFFIKLDWSSPRDAGYMTVDGTICCRSVLDAFLLLKSSDYVSHDLSHRY